MASDYFGTRLHPKKHKEIIEWLNRFEDKSEEGRRLLLLGIQVSKGEVIVKEEKNKPIIWNIPKEPTVKPMKKPNSESLLDNIMTSFVER